MSQTNVASVQQTEKMNQEIIKTSLIGKEEAFKIMALAKAMGTAVLMIGEKGVNVN